MAGSPHLRTLIESELYSRQRDEIPTDDPIDLAIRGLYWGIGAGPEKFDTIPDADWLRIAKSDEHMLGAGTVRIWFEIIDDDTVELKFIEFTPNDPPDVS